MSEPCQKHVRSVSRVPPPGACQRPQPCQNRVRTVSEACQNRVRSVSVVPGPCLVPSGLFFSGPVRFAMCLIPVGGIVITQWFPARVWSHPARFCFGLVRLAMCLIPAGGTIMSTIGGTNRGNRGGTSGGTITGLTNGGHQRLHQQRGHHQCIGNQRRHLRCHQRGHHRGHQQRARHRVHLCTQWMHHRGHQEGHPTGPQRSASWDLIYITHSVAVELPSCGLSVLSQRVHSCTCARPGCSHRYTAKSFALLVCLLLPPTSRSLRPPLTYFRIRTVGTLLRTSNVVSDIRP